MYDLYDRHPVVIKVHKTKGECRQSQLIFKLYYYVTLMRHVSA